MGRIRLEYSYDDKATVGWIVIAFFIAGCKDNHRKFRKILCYSNLRSNLLDGIAARLLGQESEFGAVLDSWADLLIYITIAISTWWLWSEMIKRELLYVVITILSYLGTCME